MSVSMSCPLPSSIKTRDARWMPKPRKDLSKWADGFSLRFSNLGGLGRWGCGSRDVKSVRIGVCGSHGLVVRCDGVSSSAERDDTFYMMRCVELAKKAMGFTSPNPMVGCVIVKDGKIVG